MVSSQLRILRRSAIAQTAAIASSNRMKPTFREPTRPDNRPKALEPNAAVRSARTATCSLARKGIGHSDLSAVAVDDGFGPPPLWTKSVGLGPAGRRSDAGIARRSTGFWHRSFRNGVYVDCLCVWPL